MRCFPSKDRWRVNVEDNVKLGQCPFCCIKKYIFLIDQRYKFPAQLQLPDCMILLMMYFIAHRRPSRNLAPLIVQCTCRCTIQVLLGLSLGVGLSFLLVRYVPEVSSEHKIYARTLDVSKEPLEKYMEDTQWYTVFYPGSSLMYISLVIYTRKVCRT